MHLPLWKLLILIALLVPVLRSGSPMLARAKAVIGSS